MRGQISEFDAEAGTGRITGDDGVDYAFDRSSMSQGQPRSGVRVDFVGEAGRAAQIMVLMGAPTGAAARTDVDAPLNWGGLFFSLKGRLRRSHFWIGWGILFVLGLICGFGFKAAGLAMAGFVIGQVVGLGYLVIGAKRFHDMGKPGWLGLIPAVLQYAGMGLMIAAVGFDSVMDSSKMSMSDPTELMATAGTAIAVTGIGALVALVFLLWLGIGDSQPGPNKYGPNPKGL